MTERIQAQEEQISSLQNDSCCPGSSGLRTSFSIDLIFSNMVSGTEIRQKMNFLLKVRLTQFRS